MKRVDERTERLIVRSIDGEITPDEARELEGELERSPDVRVLLDEYRRVDELAASAIRDAHRATTIEPLVPPPPRRDFRRPASGRWRIAAAGLVVASLALLLVWLAGGRGPAETPATGTSATSLEATLLDEPAGSEVGVYTTGNTGPVGPLDRQTSRSFVVVPADDGTYYVVSVDRVQELRRTRPAPPDPI